MTGAYDPARSLRWLLVGLGLFLFATMPRWMVTADPITMRSGTIEFITHGTFAVPAELGEGTGERGQYYCQNPVNAKWYSKYGIANSLLYLPPMLVEFLQVGELRHFEQLSHSQLVDRVFILNLFNVAVSLWLASYLFKAALLYTPRPSSAVVFVLLIFFTTFLWYYLRAQTVELFQVLFFTATYYHLARGYRSAKDGVTYTKDTIAAVLFTCLLCLEKQVFVLLLPIVTIAIASYGKAGLRMTKLASEIAAKLLSPGWRFATQVYLPGFATVAILLLHNWYCFGSPFATGYHQWKRYNGIFSASVGEGWLGFLIDPQKSIFLYFPTFTVALLGFRRFIRQHAFEAVFALSVLVVFYAVNASLMFWRGGWCYGPRYLLFVLPVLSLPLLELRAVFAERMWVPRAAVALLVAWAIVSQPLVQGAEFLIGYRVQGPFVGLEDGEIDAYFRQPLWFVHRDLLQHRMGRKQFPPLEAFARHNGNVEDAHQAIMEFPFGNFYWVSPRVSTSTEQSAR